MAPARERHEAHGGQPPSGIIGAVAPDCDSWSERLSLPRLTPRPWRVASSLQLLGLLSFLALACGDRGTEAQKGGPPTPPPEVSPQATPWFPDVSAELGLDFRHQTGAEGDLHLPEIMGSGAAWLDFDGDGDLDAYLVNGAFALGGDHGPDGPVNQLFRQEEAGNFIDVTAASGLGDPGYGMGVATGDFDNDGHVDVYVANLGADRLYRNRGDGTFQDVTVLAAVAVDGWSSSAAFFDYDRDGHLDIYVVQYVAYDPSIRCFDLAGRREYCGPTAFASTSDVLLHNEGDGTFRDRSGEAGLKDLRQAGLGVVSRDFDGDGWPDVYVANDADPNQLWINQGDGTFRDEGLVQGASVNAFGQPEAGMGVLAADLDNDLDYDLFMTHLTDESNTLYRNLGGNLGFEDASSVSGLTTTSMLFTGFGTAALDADLDGDLDLAAINGRVRRGDRIPNGLPAPWVDYAEPNLFYANDGQGRFEDRSRDAAGFTIDTEISRGLAVGDFDADGDLDLLVSNTQGPARLYRNDSPRQGHWLIVDAFDPRLHRTALGAEVRVVAGSRQWLRTISAAGSYQSSHDPPAHFGLGETNTVDQISVRWPDGLEETFPGVAVDQRLRLQRGRGKGP